MIKMLFIHRKSYFRSHDMYVILRLFGHVEKMASLER